MEQAKLDYLSSTISYIENQIKSNKFISKGQELNTHSSSKLVNDHHWINYNNDTVRLIENKLSSYMNSNNKNFSKEMDLNIRKLNVLGSYLNLVLLAICLRYIEIIVKVKRGGLYFSLFVCSSFYYSNKYFRKYKANELLKILTNDPEKYIIKLRNNQISKNKERYLTKIKLNKYWKEPMSWH